MALVELSGANAVENITLLGCGWLGLPLARTIQEKGWPLKVSKTAWSGVKELTEQGFSAFPFSLNPEPQGDPKSLLDTCDIAIVSIPPRSKSQSGEFYLEKIQNLIQLLELYQVKKVLFISTTGVYRQGDIELTENSPLKSDAATVQAEKLIRQSDKFQSSILRLAGLVGPGRAPGRFMAGKQLDAGLTPVNLIHQADCIAIILAIIQQQAWGEVLNACSDTHPSRKSFYTRAAVIAGLALPEFSKDNSMPRRSVCNNKLKARLGYEFIYPDLMVASLSAEKISQFMALAAKAGQNALPECSPNPPVGCVAVRNGEVIASGYTQPPGLHHAEAQVLAQLEGDLSDVILFVTLEPCSFQGRTPSCAKTMVARGIKEVYVALVDPHPKNRGKGLSILEESGAKVVTGVLEQMLDKQLGPYLITH